MKLLLATSVVAGVAFLTGCASHRPGLALDPVGPTPFASSDTGSTGMLMVYSAFEQGAEFNSPYYRRQYSDCAVGKPQHSSPPIVLRTPVYPRRHVVNLAWGRRLASAAVAKVPHGLERRVEAHAREAFRPFSLHRRV